jgi:NADP-dependent 3-hydroxy acid dehydrogenase YdfG
MGVEKGVDRRAIVVTGASGGIGAAEECFVLRLVCVTKVCQRRRLVSWLPNGMRKAC